MVMNTGALFVIQVILTCYTRDGDITNLKVTAIVNPTNESLMDKNAVSEKIFEVAGPELREECRQQIRSEPQFCIPN